MRYTQQRNMFWSFIRGSVRKRFLLFFLIIAWAIPVQARTQQLPPSQWEWHSLFTVPLLKESARIDGVLADNEWMFATQIGVLLDSNTLMQANQAGRFLL